jgi:hypothetical protein
MSKWQALNRRRNRDPIGLAARCQETLFLYEDRLFVLEEDRRAGYTHTLTLGEVRMPDTVKPLPDISVSYEEPVGRPFARQLICLRRRAAVKQLFHTVEQAILQECERRTAD